MNRQQLTVLEAAKRLIPRLVSLVKSKLTGSSNSNGYIATILEPRKIT